MSRLIWEGSVVTAKSVKSRSVINYRDHLLKGDTERQNWTLAANGF